MKYKNLDIKTVDLFFEIFSDSKKFLERMAEMRVIRDEILAALGMTDTKEKADRLLRQAADKEQLAGTLYEGVWEDVGTPQRLESVNERFGV